MKGDVLVKDVEGYDLYSRHWWQIRKKGWKRHLDYWNRRWWIRLSTQEEKSNE